MAQAKAYAQCAKANLGRFWRHEFHFFQGMRVLLDGFYLSIRNDTPPPLDYEEILWSVDTIDRIVEQLGSPAPQPAVLPRAEVCA